MTVEMINEFMDSVVRGQTWAENRRKMRKKDNGNDNDAEPSCGSDYRDQLL